MCLTWSSLSLSKCPKREDPGGTPGRGEPPFRTWLQPFWQPSTRQRVFGWMRSRSRRSACSTHCTRQEKVMSEKLDWILKRRSIRVYADAPVTDEQVETLLRAAMAAPSANDVRPWAFVVVRDAERREALAKIHEWSHMCAKAPVVVVVLGNPEASTHWVEDCSAATE